MKALILSIPLVFAACVAPAATVPVDGPLAGTIERVVNRHDHYVMLDPALSEGSIDAALAQSSAALGLVFIGEATPEHLSATLSPIMVRHDDYVLADQRLDELERDIYLESTERLRSLLK